MSAVASLTLKPACASSSTSKRVSSQAAPLRRALELAQAGDDEDAIKAARKAYNDVWHLPESERIRYDKQTLEPLRLWIESNRAWLAGVISLPSRDKLKANIIRYVGTWLDSLALSQNRVGKNERGQYALSLEKLESTCETLQRRGTLLPKEGYISKSVPSFESPPKPPEPRRVKLPTPPETPDGWQYKHTLILPNGAQKHVWESV